MSEQLFIRLGERFPMTGNKIRVFKRDLAGKLNLPSTEFELIHNSIILESYQMISFYKISSNEPIWVGNLSEYLEEFGPHIVVTLKSNYKLDSLPVTEKVLVKPTDQIIRIRQSLKGIYCWIENANMWNSKQQLLIDDQTVEESGLMDDPIIVMKSPVVISTNPININNSSIGNAEESVVSDKLVTEDETMKMKHIFSLLTPIIERVQTELDTKAPDGQSDYSKLMAYGKMNYKDVAKENPDFSKLIGEVFSGFDKLDQRCPKAKSQAALDKIFSGMDEPLKDDKHGVTLEEGFRSSKEFVEKAMKINERNIDNKLDPVEQQCIMKLIRALFKEIEKDEDVKNCPSNVMDGRILKYLNGFLDQQLETEGPVSGIELVEKMRSECDKNKSEFGIDVNSYISDVMTMFSSFNDLACNNVNVVPNIKDDSSFRISSGTQLTADKILNILPIDKETDKMYLTTEKYGKFLQCETSLTKDSNIAFIKVSKLNNIQITGALGDGAFGVVHKCINNSNNQIRALKEFKSQDAEVVRNLELAMPEIIANSRMGSHSRIIEYYDYYHENDKFYIEMEYMEGGSLRNHIDKNKCCNKFEIQSFSLQILEGLIYLHDAKGLCHGDIKPENILLDANKNIKLVDFGFTQYFQDLHENPGGDFRSKVCGTERYMAPELKDSSNYGPFVDIWALGITLIEMVIGNLTDYDMDRNLLKAKKKIEEEMPEILSLCDFIDGCLISDPHKRWTASQLKGSNFISSKLD